LFIGAALAAQSPGPFPPAKGVTFAGCVCGYWHGMGRATSAARGSSRQRASLRSVATGRHGALLCRTCQARRRRDSSIRRSFF